MSTRVMKHIPDNLPSADMHYVHQSTEVLGVQCLEPLLTYWELNPQTHLWVARKKLLGLLHHLVSY